MTIKAVLLIGGLTHTVKEWADLSSKYILKVGEVGGSIRTINSQHEKEFIDGSRNDFLKKLQDGEYDDVVGLYRSNTSVAVRSSRRHLCRQ
jgi:glyoxylate reductase